MKNKRIFVSGGAGVIGREMVKKLVPQGAVVMVGDLSPIPDDFPKNVIYRRGDLNYITQQELDSFNPEIFFHLAATFERSTETYEHWEENFWHNIRLSNHLMTLMRNVPDLKRVVYASSYLIYNKGSSPILMENGVKWVAWRSSKHHPSLPYYLLCKA